jgi:hypothetical protein
MRSFATAAVFVLASTRAGDAGDGCKDLEDWMRTITARTQETSKAASEAALACLTTGADDKRLAELARETRKRLAVVAAPAPKAVCASANLALEKYLEGAMHAMGEYIGFAYSACSTQARAEMAKLAAAGKLTPEDVQHVLGPLVSKYLDGAMPQDR